MTDNGIVTLKSTFSAAETVRRLIEALAQRHLDVFARIDHAANARAASLPLRPTELVIFGNPKGGTPLMQDRQTAGLDLPLKALVWEDANGGVWLTYNPLTWIAQRHGLGASSADAVSAMTAMLDTMLHEVAGRPSRDA
jgi:uncharacterized protein (DUF302 family)